MIGCFINDQNDLKYHALILINTSVFIEKIHSDFDGKFVATKLQNIHTLLEKMSKFKFIIAISPNMWPSKHCCGFLRPTSSTSWQNFASFMNFLGCTTICCTLLEGHAEKYHPDGLPPRKIPLMGKKVAPGKSSL